MSFNIGGLAFLIPVVLIVILARLVVEAATIALMFTGLDRQKARFQALSAFSGAGFTTRESEKVVSHPQRRKIISTLIILGNAGLITIIASLVGTFAKASLATVPIGLLVAAGVLFLLWRIASWTGWVKRFNKWIEHKLLAGKVFKEEKFLELVSVEGDFIVAKVMARKGSDFVDTQLAELKLPQKGLVVLAINRKGRLIRPPQASNYIRKGDILTVFGSQKQIERTF